MAADDSYRWQLTLVLTGTRWNFRYTALQPEPMEITNSTTPYTLPQEHWNLSVRVLHGSIPTHTHAGFCIVLHCSSLQARKNDDGRFSFAPPQEPALPIHTLCRANIAPCRCIGGSKRGRMSTYSLVRKGQQPSTEQNFMMQTSWQPFLELMLLDHSKQPSSSWT
jgi:hypothetical protein